MSNHNEFAAQVIRHLPNNMTDDEREALIKNPQRLKKILAAALATTITATFMTADYFITRPGLYLSDDFTSRITSAYPEALVPRGLEGVESFDLTKNSSDKIILAHSEMGGEAEVRKYAFTPDQIANLIDLQPNGTVTEKLLADSYSKANLFYVVGADDVLFVVQVFWNAVHFRWHVDAWRLDQEGGPWDAGNRVFRNTQTFEV